MSEIRVCPYSLDFKYTFQELKKSFYFRVSYIAYCNHIEDEANYNPIGFSETLNPETLTNQNYLINFNLNNGFWEKSTDLLDVSAVHSNGEIYYLSLHSTFFPFLGYFPRVCDILHCL